MWGERFEQARADHATVANAVAAFEPVLMAADPSQAREARAACAAEVDVVPIPLDDSWARDSGRVDRAERVLLQTVADEGRSGQLFGRRPAEHLVHAGDLERALEARVPCDQREL